jgi:hypothetical protein
VAVTEGCQELLMQASALILGEQNTEVIVDLSKQPRN